MRKTWDPTLPTVLLAVAMLVGTVAATGGLGRGDWRGALASDGGSVRLDLCPAVGTLRVRLSSDVPTGELEGFERAAFERQGAPIRLAWKHDAGTFVLEGEGGRRPRGRVRFEPDPAFV